MKIKAWQITDESVEGSGVQSRLGGTEVQCLNCRGKMIEIGELLRLEIIE
jgi:hypothetical protein